MSLINDALKRARRAQSQTPPPSLSDLPLRPVEAAPPAPQQGWLLPVVIGLVLFSSAFLVWRVLAHRTNGLTDLSPSQNWEVQAKALPQDENAYIGPDPDQWPPIRKNHEAMTESAPPPASQPDPLADKTPLLVASQETAITNSAPEPAVAPKPAPLRLQAILFQPNRPSALINGKTIFVGDRVGELRVTAITREAAILVGGGQTNVLALPE